MTKILKCSAECQQNFFHPLTAKYIHHLSHRMKYISFQLNQLNAAGMFLDFLFLNPYINHFALVNLIYLPQFQLSYHPSHEDKNKSITEHKVLHQVSNCLKK